MQFSQFPLDPRLLKGLQAINYETCTPVQEATLKAVLEAKKDVYAQSQTGTGKTASFLIATFWHLLKPENQDKFALILVPTRELVVQIEKEAKAIGQFLSFNMATIYGGTAYDKQLHSLRRNPRIVVATPGRLLDFADKQAINLQNAGVLVIDEADRLFDMGFHKDLLKIIKMLPAPQDRLNLLFSATLNNKVGQLAWEHMNNPESIVIKAQSPTVEGIEQRLFHVSRSEKMILLLALLKKENPESVIIFSNTKAGAGQIAKRLKAAGYNCALIEGSIQQKKRLQIINNMKNGNIKILAATDIASRGLHIPDLSLVINFDLPDDAENYIHRIGRTARGSQTTGLAISFACERFVYNLASIEKLIKKKIPMSIIDNELQQLVDLTIKEEASRPKPVGQESTSHYEHRRKDHPRREPSSSPRSSRNYGEKSPKSNHKPTNTRPKTTKDHAPERDHEVHPPREATRKPRPDRPARSQHDRNDRPQTERPTRSSHPRNDRPDRPQRSAPSDRTPRNGQHESRAKHSRSHTTASQQNRPQSPHQAKPKGASHPNPPKPKGQKPHEDKSKGIFNFFNKIFSKED
ncbi:DEAD/DEAH box helicase [Entomospira culicis]|uniref:DEAD/DEAH box helicase n=1 Tax=Entomospira culicis TaxID=2719989 RepID=A0A968GJA1_9SPIO|nr:DEAD/DEAH box helicase [Entomospira culicis]NIZ19760.1 DEAD/DEAH box helicase [Entomospira culicis]NIZ69974.1 DEAD/DEAH box helicase [Entomospira culicis]WDI37079.1 DEAD/DEAH box helicase [Entomospira culicis]WDI38708.1 DEAD/DEAH box helicase [Entomospira culicis]